MDSMTDKQKDNLTDNLYRAWNQYKWVFGEEPHGTVKQIRAMMEFMPIDPLNAVAEESYFDDRL